MNWNIKFLPDELKNELAEKMVKASLNYNQDIDKIIESIFTNCEIAPHADYSANILYPYMEVVGYIRDLMEAAKAVSPGTVLYLANALLNTTHDIAIKTIRGEALGVMMRVPKQEKDKQ